MDPDRPSAHGMPHPLPENSAEQGMETLPAQDGQDELPFHPVVGCMISILAGLLATAVLFGVARLLIDGELRFGGGELTPNRVWLVRDETNQGLAFSTGSRQPQLEREGSACVKTQVGFLLWQTDATNAPLEYCECYSQTATGWDFIGTCSEVAP